MVPFWALIDLKWRSEAIKSVSALYPEPYIHFLTIDAADTWGVQLDKIPRLWRERGQAIK